MEIVTFVVHITSSDCLNCAVCHFQLQDSGGSASGSFEQGSNINDDIRQNASKR